MTLFLENWTYLNILADSMFGTMDPFGRSSWPYSTQSPLRSTYPFSTHGSSSALASTTSTPTSKTPTSDTTSTDQNSRFPRVPDVSIFFFRNLEFFENFYWIFLPMFSSWEIVDKNWTTRLEYELFSELFCMYFFVNFLCTFLWTFFMYFFVNFLLYFFVNLFMYIFVNVFMNYYFIELLVSTIQGYFDKKQHLRFLNEMTVLFF